MDDIDPNELRKMVLTFAAGKAHEVVQTVKDGGLSMGYTSDEVEVGGVQWYLGITYHANSTFVQIQGHPKPDGNEVPHPFALLFNNDPRDHDASFAINLPAVWLPEQVQVTREPIREEVSN